MAKRKMIDLTGAPYIVEQGEDGLWYIIGIKLRMREFFFNATGIPDDIMQKLVGKNDNGKVDTLEEMEELMEGFGENEKLKDNIPDGFATDEDMINAWNEAMANAGQNASGSQEE